MDNRWYQGLDEEPKKSLLALTNNSGIILERLEAIVKNDLEASVRKMRRDEVVVDHFLLAKELGIQAYASTLLDLINQIKPVANKAGRNK